MDFDLIKTNIVNAILIGTAMMDIEQFLTILTLTAAFVYNILKIISWFNKNK